MEETDHSKYFCKQCNKEFKSPKSFKVHMNKHEGKRYSCDLCTKSYTASHSLMVHKRSHNNEKPFKCSICDARLSQKHHCLRHEKTHSHKAKPVQDNVRDNIKRLQQGVYQCKECSEQFTEKMKYHHHRQHHRNPGMDTRKAVVKKQWPVVVCKICGKVFKTMNGFRVHKNKHLGKRYCCAQCGKVFTNSDNLKEHERNHANEEGYPCTQCDKTFRRKSNLYRHKRSHLGVKRYICHICGKAFVLNESLTAHLKVHQTECSFSCEICGSSFKYMSSLKSHKKIHINVKEFKCGICNREFLRKRTLLDHLKVHEKGTNKVALLKTPTEFCILCSKGFATSLGLQRHLFKHRTGKLKLYDKTHGNLCNVDAEDYKPNENEKLEKIVPENPNKVVAFENIVDNGELFEKIDSACFFEETLESQNEIEVQTEKKNDGATRKLRKTATRKIPKNFEVENNSQLHSGKINVCDKAVNDICNKDMQGLGYEKEQNVSSDEQDVELSNNVSVGKPIKINSVRSNLGQESKRGTAQSYANDFKRKSENRLDKQEHKGEKVSLISEIETDSPRENSIHKVISTAKDLGIMEKELVKPLVLEQSSPFKSEQKGNIFNTVDVNMDTRSHVNAIVLTEKKEIDLRSCHRNKINLAIGTSGDKDENNLVEIDKEIDNFDHYQKPSEYQENVNRIVTDEINRSNKITLTEIDRGNSVGTLVNKSDRSMDSEEYVQTGNDHAGNIVYNNDTMHDNLKLDRIHQIDNNVFENMDKPETPCLFERTNNVTENDNTGIETVDIKDNTQMHDHSIKTEAEDDVNHDKTKEEMKNSYNNPKNRFKRKHFCKTCGKGFHMIATLKQHMSCHKPECGRTPIYPCEQCGRKFDNMTLLMNHTHKLHKRFIINCKFCPRKFDTVSNLKTHVYVKHKDESLTDKDVQNVPNKTNSIDEGKKTMLKWTRCSDCFKLLTTESVYGEILVHNGEKHFKCNKCMAIFRKPECNNCHDLKCDVGDTDSVETNVQEDTIKTHAKKTLTTLSCTICSVEFSSQSNLNRHCKKQHNELDKHDDLSEEDRSDFTWCENCGENFRDRKAYNQHCRSKNCRSAFHCELCNKVCKTESQLKRHLKEEHDKKPYKCEKCNKVFSSHSNLLRHQAVSHNSSNSNTEADEKLKNFMCTVCGKCYTAKDSLRIHMFTHTGERPYQCTHCSVSYTQPGHLRRHVKTAHEKMFSYTCPHELCGKSFFDISALKVHERCHTDERPYECSTCQKKFKTAHALKIHSKKHSQLREYECHLCFQGLTSKHCLVQHLKRHETSEKLNPNSLFYDPSCNIKVRQKLVKKMEDKRFGCSFCLRLFTTTRSVYAHQRKYCNGVKEGSCENKAKYFEIPKPV